VRRRCCAAALAANACTSALSSAAAAACAAVPVFGGGGVYLYTDSTFEAPADSLWRDDASTFLNNRAKEFGGGAHAWVPLRLSGTVFEGNQAGSGGGLSVTTDQEIGLDGTVFTGNAANLTYGGRASAQRASARMRCAGRNLERWLTHEFVKSQCVDGIR
jgi:predicted outer membrane repeat protein